MPQHLVVKDMRLVGRKSSAGSRIVLKLGVVKQPDRQVNPGSGKEPSDQVADDTGQPLEIQWRGSSCLEFGVRE